MEKNTKQFEFLVGTGFDVHAFESVTTAHTIVLCGVPVPCRYKVLAHSDGDVVLHALVDAMLGAIGAGDLGEHFPPSDGRWKNADSMQFVEHAVKLLREKNADVVNADVTIICEHPKIVPHKSLMRDKLSHVLGLPIERVNIKATTTEKLGFLGRNEGIAAQAVVSIKIPV